MKCEVSVSEFEYKKKKKQQEMLSTTLAKVLMIQKVSLGHDFKGLNVQIIELLNF